MRYADDFCLFFKHPGHMDIMISETRHNGQTHERRRMTFLGFTIYRANNLSQTAAKTVFRTEAKRFSRAKTAMLEKIRRIRHWPVEKQIEVINATLRGHFNYYGIAGNAGSMNRFLQLTQQAWKRSLSKRSQKGRLTWEAFIALMEKHPMAPVKVRISYPQLAAYARL